MSIILTNGKTSGYGGPLRGNGGPSLTGTEITFPIDQRMTPAIEAASACADRGPSSQ